MMSRLLDAQRLAAIAYKRERAEARADTLRSACRVALCTVLLALFLVEPGAAAQVTLALAGFPLFAAII